MSAVEVHDGFLRLRDGEQSADFHLRWLRHNCDGDRHPQTGERLVDSAELPDVLAVTDAIVDDGVLRVRWGHDDRVSRYPLAWLREHAYAIDRDVAPPPGDPRLLETSADDDILARLADRGAAVVRSRGGVPEDETEAWITAFERRGLRVIGTHFGRIEDLRTDNTTNANTDQLGYTDAAIGLHTDQPFLDEPPRYQLLQSIREGDGGDSLVADGLAAFRYL